MEESSQIWLKPKPEHIDENFDDFINYMKSDKDKDSVLYQESLKLLDMRVKKLIANRFDLPAYRHPKDSASRIFNVRLCGAWLLAIKDSPYCQRKLVLLTLINNLIQYGLITNKFAVNQESYFKKNIGDLINMALSLMAHKVPDNIKLSWSDLTQSSTDVFLHSFLTNAFTDWEDAIFEDRGVILAEGNKVTISPIGSNDLEKSIQSKSYTTFEFIEDLKLLIACPKDDIIKESKKNDIIAVEKCIEHVLQTMLQGEKERKSCTLKNYSDGDLVPIRITDICNKYFKAKSIDPDYQTIDGVLELDLGLQVFNKNYPLSYWQQALKIGDTLKARFNEKSKKFSITEDFINFIHDYTPAGTTLEARLYREVTNGFYEFITDDGIIFFSNMSVEQKEDHSESDTLTFKVLHHGEKSKSQFRGCVYAEYVEEQSEDLEPMEFNATDEILSLIKDFIDEYNDYMPSHEKRDSIVLDKYFLKEICYTLNVLQSRESDPLKRYKILAALRLLSTMAHFDSESVYFKYISLYIKMLMLFAESDKEENTLIQTIDVPEDVEDEEAISHGTDILEILSQFSNDYNKESNAILSGYIEGDDTLLSKAASLVQSYNRLKNILDAKTLKGIKRQLLNDLSIVTQGDSNLELSSQLEGPYGTEDYMKEFKESFFEAPNDAKIQDQHYTIFKCIAGMMNNRGGVLYLGVNDRGFPVGLDRDLKNLSRQYNVAATLDQLMLHINNLGVQWFDGNSIWAYVTMKADSEHNIIIFNIESYPYDAVLLKDKRCYVRQNNSTKEISDAEEIKAIRRRKQDCIRKTDDKIIILQDAKQRELKVKIHRYQSSSSETKTDRIVEPFSIIDNEYAVCYETKEKKVKVFKISRMDKVSLTKEPWKDKSMHREPNLDIFHMDGDSPTHVMLKMHIRAKNAICELYPAAKGCLTINDDKSWIFDAKINSITPLMHFYLSYADSIEIIEAPRLEESVQEYVNKYLSKKS